MQTLLKKQKNCSRAGDRTSDARAAAMRPRLRLLARPPRDGVARSAHSVFNLFVCFCFCLFVCVFCFLFFVVFWVFVLFLLFVNVYLFLLIYLSTQLCCACVLYLKNKYIYNTTLIYITVYIYYAYNTQRDDCLLCLFALSVWLLACLVLSACLIN